MRWLKTKWRMLRAFCAVKYIRFLDYLADHDFFVRKRDFHDTKFYVVEQPTLYKHFDTLRFKGRVEYVVHRVITTSEVYYYFNWCEECLDSAFKVLDFSKTEEFEVTMRVLVEEFLFHPPHFEPSIWVNRHHRLQMSVNEYRYTPLFVPTTDKIIKEAVQVKYYTVDLEKAMPQLKMKFAAFGFKGDRPRYLKGMCDRMLEHLESHAEDYQYEVSGVTDRYQFREDLIVVSDLLCRQCGSPVFQFHGEKSCARGCNRNTPVYSNSEEYLFKRVKHTDWERVCEQHRDKLNEVQQKVGIDTTPL